MGSVLLRDKMERGALDNDGVGKLNVDAMVFRYLVDFQLNFYSTDSQGGFPCFGFDRAEDWLNSEDVKDALHLRVGNEEKISLCRCE